MLSLMTVVLPSQHQRGRNAIENIENISESSTENTRKLFLTEKPNSPATDDKSKTENIGTTRSIVNSVPRRECCECSCKAGNMTKNNLPQRCPYLKGYMVEPRRQPHPHQMMHPVTLREWESLREAACYWKDKYDRLHESQRRLQKVNEGLEEKLLKVAEKFESEKADLTRDLSDLTTRLVDARLNIAELEEENEQYRNDCNIAVRLLQCKPSNFVAHKFNSLPADFQAQVKKHIHQQKSRRSLPANSSLNNFPSESSSSLLDQCPPDVKTIKVSVPTLPPAAMVYSVNNQKTNGSNGNQHGVTNTNTSATSSPSNESTPDHVSAVIIAKVLEERSKERLSQASYKKIRRCDTIDTSTQTIFTPSNMDSTEENISVKNRLSADNNNYLSNLNSNADIKFAPIWMHHSIPHTTSTETAI